MLAKAQDSVEAENDNQDETVEDDDDDEASVEEEGEETVEKTQQEEGEEGGQVTGTDQEEEEEEEEEQIKPSKDAETSILFMTASEKDLPAGGTVKILIGFHNKGELNFIVDNIDASLRYPQDFSYFIQNFTVQYYDTLVEPHTEQSLAYEFTPSETFSARSFGLTILLNYKDSEGNEFRDAVLNETINIYEQEEGVDAETFFLYVLLLAIVAVIGVIVYNYFPSSKAKQQASKPIEMGTQADAGIDQNWLPMNHLKAYNNSTPRRRSPRIKKAKS